MRALRRACRAALCRRARRHVYVHVQTVCTHTKTWLRRQTRANTRRARPARVKKAYDLRAQIGRARVCSLWLCSPPYFNIYHVKILQRSKIDNDWAAQPCSGLALPVFQQTKLYRRRCVKHTCSTPASNSNTTSQWLVAHAVAGSSPAQIRSHFFYHFATQTQSPWHAEPAASEPQLVAPCVCSTIKKSCCYESLIGSSRSATDSPSLSVCATFINAH